ncbi:hypothetical protein [Janthinobacterium sp. 17J80-10]|uniref:hypothetical protein n=1 Tax=Janthinobacterium sp. 17J80-10 TaxID=2497863 RepID=UPI00100533D9|nr:hypothetical protein [Janthinobacterium sp. 17J80-10]QAU34491.1 hypothetical protein EKL02_10035 [Janthinobacterium sp. 17J80-10]
MPKALPFPIRTECPPGACTCERERLLEDPQGDLRIMRLTREEEKRLVARLENIASYDDLKHMQERLQSNLGIVVTIGPATEEVRTIRGGIGIRLAEQPGLCRKTRQAIPAAIRRCLESKPEIAYAILDAHDLFGGNS